MSSAGWLFKHYLALLIAMIAIPLLASVAYQLHVLRELQQRMAEEAALRLAQGAAARVAGFLRETQQTAALLAERPQVRAMQRARCEALLRELYAVLPLQANASVLDLNRNFVCSARPLSVRAPPSVPPRHSAFERALRGVPSVSEPVQGILSRRIVVAAHPVSDDAGRITGVVILPIDLERLDPFAGAHAIPAGTVATVVTGEGMVVAQSADAESWIGRDLREAPLLEKARGLQSGMLTAAGFDGVERIYGIAPIAGPGWRVFVGVPAAALLAGARERFRSLVLFSVVLVMLLALGTAGVVRRLAKPVADMAAALKEEPAGSYEARLPEAGPRELADLARAFNAAFAAERESARRYRALFDQAVFGVAETDAATGRFLQVNRRFCEMLGYSEGEMLALDIRTVTHPEDLPGNLAFSARLRAGELHDFSMEKRYRRRDGGIVWANLTVTALWRPGEPPTTQIAVIHDISERKRIEAAVQAQAKEVRQLSARMSTVEEDERRAIHRELHDQIGANLSALRFELGALEALLAGDLRQATRGRLQGAQRLADETIHRTRNVMAELRPPALDDFGLVAALRVYAESQSARLGTSVKVSGTDLVPRPVPAVETALFRIAQEALNNIAKHARARRVEVSVRADGGRVTLVVEDDGVGFDSDADRPRRDGWGLKTMSERAQAAGARLRVASRPGKGTRVVIELPPEPG